MKPNDFWNHHIENESGCWVWQLHLDICGYGAVTVYTNGKKKTWKAHRYAYLLHHGSIPHGKVICHTCDNPACINPAHLWVGTMKDNVEDMIQKGRRKDDKGENNPRARLTETIVKLIRLMPDVDAKLIAEVVGVRRNAIYDIRNKVRWTHVR